MGVAKVSNRGPDILAKILFSESDYDTLQCLIGQEKYRPPLNRMCTIRFRCYFVDFARGILFKM